MTLSIAIPYHSGFGHTAKVAEAVAEGARSVVGVEVVLLPVEALTEAEWHALDQADAIILGSPTYMGSVSAPFKAFMDSTSKRWMNQLWKDKIAAGFTNSGTIGGDNLNALYQLMVFAMQHSMVWVGNGQMPHTSDVGEINRLGAFMGLMTQAGNGTPEVTPPREDIETAKLFGVRVAETTLSFDN